MLTRTPIGQLLHDWRRQRRMSQLDLALEADLSARHLSFLETGRARPSRAMVLRLSEALNLPLRERNDLLNAAGFAPVYARKIADTAMEKATREALFALLHAHAPFPALALDRHWGIAEANSAIALLLDGVAPHLLDRPNALRISLHPEGLAPRIVNYAEWRGHLLARLRQQINQTADPVLASLMEEVKAYPAPRGRPQGREPDTILPVIPLRLDSPAGPLSFISTTTVFGTPLDVTLSELAIETFFPADESTRQILLASTQSKTPQV